MSLADKIFIDTCTEIINNGVWDTNLPVRPVCGETVGSVACKFAAVASAVYEPDDGQKGICTGRTEFTDDYRSDTGDRFADYLSIRSPIPAF